MSFKQLEVVSMMHESIVSLVKHLVEKVGRNVAKHYANQTQLFVSTKADNSPVTQADLDAHAALVAGLTKISPDVPVLSEEGAHPDLTARKKWQRYWLVDPIDGTQEFLRKNEEFTVNVALIEKNTPTLGVIYNPMSQIFYYAEFGRGAFKQVADGEISAIKVKTNLSQPLSVVISRRHGLHPLRDALEKLDGYQMTKMGSSQKFGVVAEGLVDLYPCLGQTSEWDTAAGQCILEAAGGKVIDLNGKPLVYNKTQSLLNNGFLAVSAAEYDWLAHFHR